MEPVGSQEPPAPAAQLVEVVLETAPEAGVTGISLAGGGKEGIYVRDVQRDSSAAKGLRLRQGDQLLSARVFFDNVHAEDAARLLQCAQPCKVSLCLKRTVASSEAATQPGAGGDTKGPKAKVARLSIKSLTPLKKKKKKVPRAPVAAAAAPVDVEFSLPRLSRLVRGRRVPAVSPAQPPPAEPKRARPPPSRLTVREAAALEEPRWEVAPEPPKVSPEAGEPRFRAPRMELDVAAPKVYVGLSLPGSVPLAAPASPEPPPRAPALEIAVPAPALELQLPAPRRPAEPRDATKGPQMPLVKAGDRAGLPKLPAVKVPSIEIAVPSTAVELLPAAPELPPPPEPPGKFPFPRVDLSVPKADVAPARLSLPPVPALDITVPPVSLALELPVAREAAAEGPGAGQAPEPVALERSLRKLSLEPELEGSVGKAKAPKFTLPRLVPKGKLRMPPAAAAMKLPQVELPGMGADGPAGPEPGDARALRVPSVSAVLPALELDVGLPRSAGNAERRERSSSAGPGPGSPRLRVPQLHVVLPALRRSDPELLPAASGGASGASWLGLPKGRESERPLGWSGMRLPRFGGSSPDVRSASGAGASGRAPSLPDGLPVEATEHPEGKFRLKVPVLGLGKAGAAGAGAGGRGSTGAATFPCALPHVSIPDVGFSANGEWEMGSPGMQVPKSRLPAEPAGKRPVLKVPELELAAPGEGPGILEPPGKRSRVKLPRFSIIRARGVPEGSDEVRMRMGSVRKAVLELVRPKGFGAAGPLRADAADKEHREHRWHLPRLELAAPARSVAAGVSGTAA